MPPDDWLVCGAVERVSGGDDVSDDCGGLDGCDGLDDDEELSLGAGLEEVADTAGCEAAELVQDELGLGWTVFLAVPPGEGSSLALLWDGDWLVVGVASGVTLGVTLVVGLGLRLVLGEELAGELTLLLGLPVWLPLGEVTGAVVVLVALGELLVLSAMDGCVDCAAHGLSEG